MKNKTKVLIRLVVILAVGIGIWITVSASRGPGTLDAFASCLKEKGATFYGAFWCPHCQNEKKMFGSSQKFLPYVECSTPDGQNQLPICKEKHINGYPTWEFVDGTRESGEVSLKVLSEKTSCALLQ